MRITRSVYILSDRKRQKRRYVQERISSCISGGEHVQLKEAGCIIEGITPEDEEFQMLLEQGQCRRSRTSRRFFSREPEDFFSSRSTSERKNLLCLYLWMLSTKMADSFLQDGWICYCWHLWLVEKKKNWTEALLPSVKNRKIIVDIIKIRLISVPFILVWD